MMTPTERPGIPRVIAPPPLIFGIPFIAGMVLQHYRPLLFLPAVLAYGLGIPLLLGFFVGIPAVIAFKRAGTSPNPWKPSSALVTTGPYRFTRNPMYLGMLCGYLGGTCLVNSAYLLAFLPIILGAMHFGVIRREEAYLGRLFGEEYLAYRRRVRRWL